MGYSPWGHKESDKTEQLGTYIKVFGALPSLHSSSHSVGEDGVRGWDDWMASLMQWT